VADAIGQHRAGHLGQGCVQGHRGRLPGHVLAGGAVGQVASVGHGPDDVALGDDPDQPVAVQDDQR
jgi:hypothetical protein